MFIIVYRYDKRYLQQDAGYSCENILGVAENSKACFAINFLIAQNRNPIENPIRYKNIFENIFGRSNDR